MTGTVLVVFGSNGSGRILGEDNQYQDFNTSDYSDVLKKGFQVQFEPHNSFAKRIAILPQMKSRTEASLSPNEHFSSSTADSNNFVQRLPGSGGWLWNYIGAYTLQILFVTQTIPSGWRVLTVAQPDVIHGGVKRCCWDLFGYGQTAENEQGPVFSLWSRNLEITLFFEVTFSPAGTE